MCFQTIIHQLLSSSTKSERKRLCLEFDEAFLSIYGKTMDAATVSLLADFISNPLSRKQDYLGNIIQILVTEFGCFSESGRKIFLQRLIGCDFNKDNGMVVLSLADFLSKFPNNEILPIINWWVEKNRNATLVSKVYYFIKIRSANQGTKIDPRLEEIFVLNETQK